ncbi:MAG TPA: hypothetical protein VMI32_11475 [Candidatus Solibacter sp.]|nr:hypothetical protein [Candidatus Solibacter sp.]
MTAPDYISPMVGYRVWQWDAKGLKSLNGARWHPGSAFAAECKSRGCQEAPQSGCTCGVYASKSFNHLRQMGYAQQPIHGEVWVWGTVVEHEEGWRARYAYPKSFLVPLSRVPFGMSGVATWVASLAAYGCDISLLGEAGTVPLWRKGSGVEADGIDLLMRRCSRWYARRAEQRRIKQGDRVAVLGHGIAIVEHADKDQVRAVLGNKSLLGLERKQVIWDERNVRWETVPGAGIRFTARKLPHVAQKRFA